MSNTPSAGLRRGDVLRPLLAMVERARHRDRWPPKEQRTQRLEECVDVIRRLLAGEEVSHDGLVRVHRARLWDLPDDPPLLLAPVVSLESASRVAAWADGLITINQPEESDNIRKPSSTPSAATSCQRCLDE